MVPRDVQIADGLTIRTRRATHTFKISDIPAPFEGKYEEILEMPVLPTRYMPTYAAGWNPKWNGKVDERLAFRHMTNRNVYFLRSIAEPEEDAIPELGNGMFMFVDVSMRTSVVWYFTPARTHGEIRVWDGPTRQWFRVNGSNRARMRPTLVPLVLTYGEVQM
jgi:hypothetical protein